MAALAEFIQESLIQKTVEPLFSLQGLPMPVTLRLAVPLTDEELIKFSRENRPYRIEQNEAGELEIMSPTGFDGSARELFAGRMLGNWADDHGGQTVGATAGFKLGGKSVRCPDAAWVSDAWMDKLTKAEREGYAPACAEFLIEVRSKKDSRLRLEAKMQMWLEAGALLAWMIDPFAGDVVVYRPDVKPQRFERPEFIEADSVVTGFRLEMAKMWESEE